MQKLQNFLGVISKVISIIAFASKEGDKLFSIVIFNEFVSVIPTSEWNDIIYLQENFDCDNWMMNLVIARY